MGHDVFISFSSVNTEIAEKIRAALEESGNVRCWIAYRDITPSANYAEQLVRAIETSKMLLLILSAESNKSPQVLREVERAGSKGIPILPLLIEKVTLSKSMEYFISSHHWLAAYDADIESCFPALINAVNAALTDKKGEQTEANHPLPENKERKPAKRTKMRNLTGAGAALMVLVAAFIFFRPEQQAPAIEPDPLSRPVSRHAAADSVTPEDALILELARRFSENRPQEKPDSDIWTSSSPLAIAFLDIAASGINDPHRDLILAATAEGLRQSRRYAIVERQIIDRLLRELNLSSSELADPATALKLGRILSADLIVAGSLARQGDEWLANLRFIETETTAIRCSVAEIFADKNAGAVAEGLTGAIEHKLRQTYPLQGRIFSVSGNSASINIGRGSGVETGMVFDLLAENNTEIDTAIVTSMEEGQSRIDLSGNAAVIVADTRLRERI